MRPILTSYISAFKDLSTPVWWLSLITLINRAGTMVIPFLSIYLAEGLQFSLEQVGWIMTAFGFGSLVGSWLGGKLTDSIGFYKVMYTSLLLAGIGFLLLQTLSNFYPVALGIFLIMIAADMFRPAVFVAIAAYSKPENRTRSISLVRLAINLGFSAGPALGGILIATMGYSGLFWVDGLTCILAGLLLLKLLNPKKQVKDQHAQKTEEITTPAMSPYKDNTYLIFIFATLLFGLIFIQYFSTVPLFYKQVHHLEESSIGALLAMNGLLIFIFEMPLIKFLEQRTSSSLNNIMIGLVLTVLSFAVLNLGTWPGQLVTGMIMMTLGEMIAFPFSNAMAFQMAQKGKQGAYMALYTISFSLGHLFGHNSGMQLASRHGYNFTWWVMTLLGGISLIFFLFLKFRMKRESQTAS